MKLHLLNSSAHVVLTILTPLSIFLFSCSENENNVDSTPTPPVAYRIEIDPQDIHQEIAHFGASDAWSGQFVGKWPESKKNAIADLLFSKDLDEQGNPTGIGLSLWRFNLGAGSTAQGEASGIRDPWRRAPSFMDASGNFNRESQAGQLWLAKAAQSRSVEHLLAFLNSPPVWLTKNGKAYASNANESNLAPENHEAFASYITATLQGMQQEGLQVAYISPVNEPQWDWTDGGQEGTPFWNDEIAAIAKALDKKITQSGLQTKIDIAEAGQIEYLYGVHNRPGRSDQISEFFDQNSPNYVGDLTNLSKNISGHSYFTTSPFQQAVSNRKQVAQAVASIPGLGYWMSEYCILGDNDGEIEGNGKDLGITPALYMARVIHNDLTVAQASAWHWWLAISPYDYKDGLVYITKTESDGEYQTSKMLWALGNYSRFIRPGFHRIGVKINGQAEQNQNLLASAYQAPDTGELVVVVVNSSIEDAQLTLDPSPLNKPASWKGYLTDQENDLASLTFTDGENMLIPARSIVTLISKTP